MTMIMIMIMIIVNITPVITGAIGTLSNRLEQHLKSLYFLE